MFEHDVDDDAAAAGQADHCGMVFSWQNAIQAEILVFTTLIGETAEP